MTEVAAWIWAGLATIGALAAGVVRWRTDGGTEAARIWQENAEAYRAQAEQLKTAVTDLTHRVERIEQENAILRSLHDSRAEIAQLVGSIAEIKTLIVGRNA